MGGHRIPLVVQYNPSYSPQYEPMGCMGNILTIAQMRFQSNASPHVFTSIFVSRVVRPSKNHLRPWSMFGISKSLRRIPVERSTGGQKGFFA